MSKKINQYPVHSISPYIGELVDIINKPRFKRKAYATTKQKIVDPLSGELNDQTLLVLGEQKIVDAEQFCKIYTKQVGLFFDLSKTAQNVIRFIIEQDLIKKDEDKIHMAYQDFVEAEYGSRPTFYKGVSELLEANILARGPRTTIYYINPTVLFNGNRITMIRQYVKEQYDNQIPED